MALLMMTISKISKTIEGKSDIAEVFFAEVIFL